MSVDGWKKKVAPLAHERVTRTFPFFCAASVCSRYISCVVYCVRFILRKYLSGGRGGKATDIPYPPRTQCAARFHGERSRDGAENDVRDFVEFSQVTAVAAAATTSSLIIPRSTLIARRSIPPSLRARKQNQTRRSSAEPTDPAFGMAPAIKVSDERAQQVDALSLARARYAPSYCTHICIFARTRVRTYAHTYVAGDLKFQGRDSSPRGRTAGSTKLAFRGCFGMQGKFSPW